MTPLVNYKKASDVPQLFLNLTLMQEPQNENVFEIGM